MKTDDSAQVSTPLISRQRAIGLAGSAIWLIVISTVFVTWSLLAIGTLWAGIGLGVMVLVVAAFLVLGIAVLRAALRRPDGGGQRTPGGNTMRRKFLWVFGAEVAAFSVVNPLVAATGHYELMPSLNLIIVGIHFLPLARVFHVRRYFVTGVLFCVVPIVTLLTIPEEFKIGNTLAWYVVPSMGCGLVAALTAAAGLREAWYSMSDAHASTF